MGSAAGIVALCRSRDQTLPLYRPLFGAVHRAGDRGAQAAGGRSIQPEIGKTLGIEERTVKAHVAKLMRKVGVENRIALSIYAVTHSIVAPNRE